MCYGSVFDHALMEYCKDAVVSTIVIRYVIEYICFSANSPIRFLHEKGSFMQQVSCPMFALEIDMCIMITCIYLCRPYYYPNM